MVTQVQERQRGATADDLVDETASHIQRRTSYPRLTAAIGSLHPQRLACVIHQHERRSLRPQQARGMTYDALEDLIEIEASRDIAADLDEGAELRFLPQQVTVQRVVVQGMGCQIRQRFQERGSIVFRPYLRQIP
jgi:hypothetical protein